MILFENEEWEIERVKEFAIDEVREKEARY